jgi:tellurite methyltransferase
LEEKYTEPFWEKTYSDDSVTTFAKGPTSDVAEFTENFKAGSIMLDVGCGEGRNSIYLAGKGHQIEAFDISHSGIRKAIKIAENVGVKVNFYQKDLAEFVFKKKYDVVLSSGVLHLPEVNIRNQFIAQAIENTVSGGYNVIGIFTDRLPATPDNAPFTKSLFKVGEILEIYKMWEILRHKEGTFKDQHPGNISHEHSFETIIARKP